ncbi:hypothetical protein PV08_07942 [Exophiala spinifera]|uniref:Amino acid transporter transmembrane domain-containing protein n=1 Tax=Exophiala spinifera TaxID=91928 RepID=A0A0D1YCS9_9EURO|nr:uncharacterized protein PV08_07942 [Exophiala spinifera]KIW12756.1 hypothetical protein PV08_07942 [Exophiala spinifera]
MSIIGDPHPAASTATSDISSAGQDKMAYISEELARAETKAEGDLVDMETHEVFKKSVDGVEFRTVSWQKATLIFSKIEFAMSILAIPSALGALGAVGGGLSIVGWTTLNTYTGVLLGGIRNRHPECHTLADMMALVWGKWGREFVIVQLVIIQILVCASGIISTGTGLNALSNHSACTVVFNFASAAMITICSSIRTFSRLGLLTWFGFATFFISVFIFSVAVSQQDRPAAAPQTGPFDLGFVAVRSPGFIVGMLMTLNIFVSTSGPFMYLPVIAEMKNPKDFKKATILAGVIVGIIYFTFSMVIYAYCGVWIASPAFGSAGTLFKKISYGVAMPGLVIGVGLYQHVAAKYLFVRILRNSRHLQANTLVHWGTWLGVNLCLGTLGFIVAEAVPVLNFLLGLSASLGSACFSLIYPIILWANDFREYRTGTLKQKANYVFNVSIAIIGVFILVGGTYADAISIRDAFRSGFISKVFDCADNSGSVATG